MVNIGSHVDITSVRQGHQAKLGNAGGTHAALGLPAGQATFLLTPVFVHWHVFEFPGQETRQRQLHSGAEVAAKVDNFRNAEDYPNVLSEGLAANVGKEYSFFRSN